MTAVSTISLDFNVESLLKDLSLEEVATALVDEKELDTVDDKEEIVDYADYGHTDYQHKLSKMTALQQQIHYMVVFKNLTTLDITKVDIDKSGRIELDELEVYCARYWDIAVSVIVNVFYDINSDHSGQISPQQYLTWKKNLTIDKMAELCQTRPLHKRKLTQLSTEEVKKIVVDDVQLLSTITDLELDDDGADDDLFSIMSKKQSEKEKLQKQIQISRTRKNLMLKQLEASRLREIMNEESSDEEKDISDEFSSDESSSDIDSSDYEWLDELKQEEQSGGGCCSCFSSKEKRRNKKEAADASIMHTKSILNNTSRMKKRLTLFIIKYGDHYIDDGTMIISVKRLRKVCTEVDFNGETGIYLWCMIMDKQAQKSYDCLWVLLRYLAEQLPTPLSIELLSQFKNELNRHPPEKIEGIMRVVVDNSTFGVATALVCACQFKQRAEEDLSNVRIYSQYVDDYCLTAVNLLKDIESDYLATMAIQTKSFHDYRTPFEIAVEGELLEFLSSDRLARIGHSMWTKKDLMKPELSADSFEVNKIGVLQIVRALTKPYEFYFTPLGFNVIQTFLFLLYLGMFTALTFKKQNVFDPIEWYDWVFWFANFGYIFNEVLQLMEDGTKKYLSSWENLLDIIVSIGWILLVFFRLLATLLTFVVTKYTSYELEFPEDGTFNIMFHMIFVINAVLLWAKCLNFLTLSDAEGPLLNVIMSMVADVTNFFQVFIVISSGFMFAMFFLVGDTNQLFSTPGRSAQIAFLIAIGQPDWVQISNGTNETLSALNSYLIMIYLLIGFVLLFNLLIAMMADTYDQKNANGQASKQVLLNKTSVAFELDASSKIMPPPLNAILLGLFVVYSIIDLLMLALTGMFINEAGFGRYWRCKNSNCKFLNSTIEFDEFERTDGENEDTKHDKTFLCGLCDRKHSYKEVKKSSRRRVRRPARGMGGVKKNCCIRIAWGIREVFNTGKVKWKHHSWLCHYCRKRIPRNKPADLNRYFKKISEIYNLDENDVCWIKSLSPSLCPFCFRPRDPRSRQSYIMESLSFYTFLLLVLPLMWFFLWPIFVYDRIYNPESVEDDYDLFETFHNRAHSLRPNAVKHLMPKSFAHQQLLSLHHPIWRQLHAHRSENKTMSLEAVLHRSNTRFERVLEASNAAKRREIIKISKLVMDVIHDIAQHRIQWSSFDELAEAGNFELDMKWFQEREMKRSETKRDHMMTLLKIAGINADRMDRSSLAVVNAESMIKATEMAHSARNSVMGINLSTDFEFAELTNDDAKRPSTSRHSTATVEKRQKKRSLSTVGGIRYTKK